MRYLTLELSTEVTLNDMGRKTVGNDLDNASIRFHNMRYHTTQYRTLPLPTPPFTFSVNAFGFLHL